MFTTNNDDKHLPFVSSKTTYLHNIKDRDQKALFDLLLRQLIKNTTWKWKKKCFKVRIINAFKS